MLQIELVPDLDHCIETVAKREHAAVLKQLLTPGKGNKELEEKLEILRLFLGRADLRQLRTDPPFATNLTCLALGKVTKSLGDRLVRGATFL